jgi:hypothetical protein
MLNVADYGAMLLSELALATDKLAMGLLMHPAQVARTVTPVQPDAVSGRWWVCGSLHPRMFAAAQKEPLRHLGKVITTPAGTRYLVLAQQVGEWQHRLMLQVAGRQVADFLKDSLDSGFELSLGLAGGDESLLVAECRFLAPMLGGLDLKSAAMSPLSAHQLRQEACRVAITLLAPDEVTAEELPAPRHTCVSIVASSELVAAVVEETGAA